MNQSRSRSPRRIWPMAAVVAAMLLAALPTAFRAESARLSLTGPFAGAVVNHFGVVVSNVDEAAPKYAELFGITGPAPREFKPILFPPEYAGDRDAHPKFVMLQLGGSGMEVMTPVGGPSPWRAFHEKYGEQMQHITFTVPNTLAAVEHLKKLGGTHELGAVQGVAYAYVNFKEQLGFTMELGQGAPTGITPPPGPSPTPTSLGTSPVHHVGVVVPNAEKSAALFAQILGVAAPPVQNVKDASIKMVVFPLNVNIAFIEPVGKGPWRDHLNKYGPSIHHVGVVVDDMKKYSSYLEGKGGKRARGTVAGATLFDLRPRYAFGVELDPR